jgi:L-cysteine:1D-myo-inositol 2-amino-2-deoxy-alpha-D-glucopyranoside ligase
MVGYQGTKMSKSLGNLVFVRDLLKTWEPAAIRLAILAHRYRLDWEWEEHLPVEATARLARWRGQGNGEGGAPPAAVPASGYGGGRHGGGRHDGARHDGARHDSGRDVIGEVRAALDDDLDTPAALTAIDAAAAGAAGHESLVAAAALLGVVL